MSFKIFNVFILCVCVCLGVVIFEQYKDIKDLERQYSFLYTSTDQAFTTLLEMQKDTFCPLFAKDITDHNKKAVALAKCSSSLPSDWSSLMRAYRKKRLEQDLKNGLY